MFNQAHAYEKAKQFIPGGVNSPVRAFNGVGGAPVFMKSAQGAYLVDENNKEYIDYIGSWGPMILGHNHPDVIAAVHQAVDKGLSFGTTSWLEVEMAKQICNMLPHMEMVRMVNSGTEATMSAIRLARGFTGRDKFIKFEGCYHGHSDALLVKAGSGALTLGVPSSPGVPESFTEHTLIATFNDLDSVAALFEKHGDQIGAIIVEPYPGNMNFIPPQPGFLQGLRALCDQYHALLIFDEVMSGFRVALGGAQALTGVTPDMTTLGKIIGGGMPVGAFGGRREIMEHLAPIGGVYQAGTLSGNPIAMTAGLATLKLLTEDIYQTLEQKLEVLLNAIALEAQKANVPFHFDYRGGMFGLFFSEEETITTYQQVCNCDQVLFKKFFHSMLEQGIYLAPSAFEAGFISTAHGDRELNQTIAAAQQFFSQIRT